MLVHERGSVRESRSASGTQAGPAAAAVAAARDGPEVPEHCDGTQANASDSAGDGAIGCGPVGRQVSIRCRCLLQISIAVVEDEDIGKVKPTGGAVCVVLYTCFRGADVLQS